MAPDERAALTAAVQTFNDRATEVIGELRERVNPVKLGPITVIGVRNGTLRVAIDYEGPAPTVYALVAAASTVLAEREAAA